ncbi:MAG: hypothetical protein WCO63_05380 [Bacteroidota bacterium]
MKYTIPALLVLAATYLLMRYTREQDLRLKSAEIKQMTQPIVLPMRFQAYERVVLLLERISPSSLILRVNQPGMDSIGLQKAMLGSIREEYDHNLSQQVYISIKAWDVVLNAKEEMIRLVNVSASEIADESPSMELAQRIFEHYLKSEKPLVSNAIEILKRELAQLF